MIALAEILRRHWPAYRAQFGNRIPWAQRAAVTAILSCRTPALGGQLHACACGQTKYVYHSCGHRACLQCGQADAAEWTEKQKAKLLPVPYFLVTFTVPEQLRRIIRDHPEVLLARLFQESAGTLQDIARHRKHLGAQLGLLGVLHTWTRQLEYHPHIHYLIPGGGLRPDGLRWCQVADPQFFLPERLLAARWRSRLRQALREDHPALYRQIPGEAWTRGWVVDVLPVGGGQTALQYLSAYIYKTALSPPRLVACDEHTVTFTWRNRVTNRDQPLRLPAAEFLRRFPQHVLPSAFQRVRTFARPSTTSPPRRHPTQALPARHSAHPPSPPPTAPPNTTCHHAHH